MHGRFRVQRRDEARLRSNGERLSGVREWDRVRGSEPGDARVPVERRDLRSVRGLDGLQGAYPRMQYIDEHMRRLPRKHRLRRYDAHL
jgi:hypothetical protein